MADLPVKQAASVSQIVGNDELYIAAVDSEGRIATNANVTFPETIYEQIEVTRLGTSNANVAGTPAAPANFRWTPSAGAVWYLESLDLLITDNANFSNSGFGGLAQLPNGVHINIRSKGQVFRLVKLNQTYDIIKHFTADVFSSVATGLLSTDRIYRGGLRLQNRIAIDPALGDYVELQVRDNLTGLTGLYLSGKVWRPLG